jgi:hypothetical protein
MGLESRRRDAFERTAGAEDMNPPMFSQPATGNEAQQYLHRARMFERAAVELPAYYNSEVNWPRYALLFHAIELALKAFNWHSVHVAGKPSIAKEPRQHDLSGWYEVALEHGLARDDAVANHIAILSELHSTHYTRYPTHRIGQVPDVEAIVGDTVESLISTFTKSINPC